MGLQSLVPHKNRHATGGSDALSPSDIGAQPAGAYATLDSNNKLTASQLPDLAITEFLGACADQTEMLAKTGQKGDWVTRSDDGKVYVITGETPSEASSWTALVYPVAPSQVNSDWNATSGAAEILNKPTIPALTTNTVPENLAGTAEVGTSTEAARADHRHRLPNARAVGAGTRAEVGLRAPIHFEVTISGATPSFLNGSLKYVGVDIDQTGFSRPRYEGTRTTGETVVFYYEDDVYRLYSSGVGGTTFHTTSLTSEAPSPVGLTDWVAFDDGETPFAMTVTGVLFTGAIEAHASTHAANGSDALTPADIGAASSSDLDQLFALNLALS